MRKETEDRLRLWIVGLCIIELFVLVNMIMVASASEITLSPSTINLTIYSGENKTVNIMLESDTTTTVEITHKITKNTSNLQGFHIAYPREFKVEKNREVTVPVSVWLVENFGPNNITINFQAGAKGTSGGGGSVGRNVENTTVSNYTNYTKPVNATENHTRPYEPWKEPSIEASWWKWWYLTVILLLIIAALIVYLWIRHRRRKEEEIEVELTPEQLDRLKRRKQEVKKNAKAMVDTTDSDRGNRLGRRSHILVL